MPESTVIDALAHTWKQQWAPIRVVFPHLDRTFPEPRTSFCLIKLFCPDFTIPVEREGPGHNVPFYGSLVSATFLDCAARKSSTAFLIVRVAMGQNRGGEEG